MAFEALAAQPGRPRKRERAQRAICHLAQPSAESGRSEKRSRSLGKRKSITAAGERRQVCGALNTDCTLTTAQGRRRRGIKSKTTTDFNILGDEKKCIETDCWYLLNRAQK